MTKKLLYIRSGPYKPNINTYNMQEIGIGKAFLKRGINVDLVFFSDENKIQIVSRKNDCELRILWKRGIKWLRTGLYPELLKKDFLSIYDIVIVTEYSQIMSVLVSKRHDNTYLYNGPYYNLFKIPFIQPIYDLLFISSLNKNIKHTFVKSKMSEEFLKKKGMIHISTVGVALDTNTFEDFNKEIELSEYLEFIKGKKVLLFIGSLIPRKNLLFLLRVYQKVRKSNDNVVLVVVGSGKKIYKYCCDHYIKKNNMSKDIFFINKIKNKDLVNIYKTSNIFILPSKKEIFGMVLLEAMYFKLPVISSLNGGTSTLIDNYKEPNGVILKKFDIDLWAKKINELLNKPSYCDVIGENASECVKRFYNWDYITKKILDEVNYDN